MKLITLSGLVFGLSMSLAQAADMGAGTLTLSESELSFSGGPGVGANLSPDVGQFTCQDPVLPCDDFSLSSELPADIGEYFPNSQIQIDLSIDSPTGQDDYDLFLFNDDGDQIAESTNEGGPERVSTIALAGLKNYGVRVNYWAVVGGSYETTIRLDLGAPNPNYSEAEITQWLLDNGAEGHQARAEASPFCSEPGPILLTDPAGDGGVAVLPVPGSDLQSLSVFQTQDENGDDLIGFQLIVDSLSQLIPQTVYFVSFETLFGVPMGVRMVVDQNSAVSFISYTVGPDSDDEYEGHFVAANSAKPAHELSNYSTDGVITIYAKPEDIGLLLPGDPLLGFNAAVIINVGVEGAGLALNADFMPDSLERQGRYSYLSQDECQGNTAERAAPLTTSTTPETATHAASRGGGSLGSLLFSLLLLAGARRKLQSR